jgi:anaerobic selenocysteine-containing dehydrogenase
MEKNLSRREFLKIIGFGCAISAISTGGGPLSRPVSFQPRIASPEFILAGQSGSFATTCGECSAGCGLLVRTVEGRAQKVEGNPDHPVNQGKTCARGQAALDGPYNPQRIKGPLKQAQRGSGHFDAIGWDTAIGVVKEAMQNTDPGGVAFLMGLFPDHLHDLAQMMANAAGATTQSVSVLRYGTLGGFEGRVTLMDAAQKLFGVSKVPYFDMQHAAVTFSFGADFAETWISPVAYTRQYRLMRQGYPGRHGYLVQFEPRRSQTAAMADEWIPLKPGTEALVAMVLANLAVELEQGASSQRFSGISLADVAGESGVAEADLRRLARIFIDAPRKLAIPGGVALGSTNGLAAAEAILALNILANNLGREGGLFFTPDFLINSELVHRPSTIAEMNALVERMRSGQIKVLFVHGANPLYELPAKMGFSDALKNVPRVISFASFPDETSSQADYVLPDHTPLESWGYQKVITGGDRLVISGLQPVVAPLYDTRATADVLLAAVQAVGGDLAAALPFQDELDFLQKSVAVLMGQDGFYDEADVRTFWSRWQQYGGWWRKDAGLSKPEALAVISQPTRVDLAQYAGEAQEYPYYLLLFPCLDPGNASSTNRPWLQETSHPMSSTMCKTWVEINPLTARALRVCNDDVVKISSPTGEIEAIVYEYPAIRRDVVAIPIRQGLPYSGGTIDRRGSNPLSLLVLSQDNSGNLAFMGTRVRVTPTERRVWQSV